MASKSRRFSLASLRANFEPPDLGRVDLNRRARLLHTILIFLLGFTFILGFIYWLLVPGWLGRFFIFLAIGIELLSLFILKSGRLYRAGAILVYMLWVVLMLIVLLSDGIRGPAVLGHVLLILMGGLLISTRFAAVLTALTLLGNYAALLLELNDGLIYANQQLTLPATWTFQSAFFLLALGLVVMLGRSIRESLDVALDNAQGLKEHVAELRLAQAQLEMSDRNLRRREAILDTLRITSEKLFRGRSLGDSIQEVLKDLGEATDVDRVYIFENHVSETGDLLASQRYEWVAKGVEAQIDNPELQSFSYAQAGFSRWGNLLRKNEIVKGRVKEFPSSEHDLLSSRGILSILVVPIFVGDEWWGFMGFDETQKEREWSPAEEDALLGAGGLLGGAIERRRAEQALNRSEARYLAILQDQFDMICRYHPDGRLIFANEAYTRFFGMDPSKIQEMNVWSQVPKDGAEALKAKIASLTPSQPVAISQSYNTRADDEPRWIEWTERGVFDEQGQLFEIQSVGRDIHEEVLLRKQLEENLIQMENQAMSDPLTGLLNRRAIMEHAEAEWQRAQRERRPLSLVVMDVDRLKEINDTFGHLVGDRALTQLADLMRTGMRRYDWVGRWGGDEFLLVLPGTGLQKARDVAERLRVRFKQNKIQLKADQEIELHVSLGVASQANIDQASGTLQNLLARADQALYKAKQAGRDKVEVKE
ncbi:MAG: diguanylate cyclase [Chloroflexi bacterium]|nr:diguanylate cyclase [Chloroflexota bacterium]